MMIKLAHCLQKNSSVLFNFEGHGSLRSSKLLTYLAEVVVNGPGKQREGLGFFNKGKFGAEINEEQPYQG